MYFTSSFSSTQRVGLRGSKQAYIDDGLAEGKFIYY